MAEQCDIAVVGGGLLGTASAYHLARSGARVILLEKDQLNAHASGQNAGSLHFQLEYRMVEHGDELAEQFARHLPLVLDVQSAWATLGAELEPRMRRRGGYRDHDRGEAEVGRQLEIASHLLAVARQHQGHRPVRADLGQHSPA